MGTINITGKAIRKVQPDQMAISIIFSASERKSAYATKQVMEQCDRFIERMVDTGLNKAAITLDDHNNGTSVSRYSDNPEQVSASRGIQILLPYSAERLNDILFVLNEGDYDFEYDVSYRVSDEKQIIDELLREALADSKAKAELMADSLPVKLKGVKKIYDEHNFEERVFAKSIALEERERCIARPASASDDLKASEKTLMREITVIWNVE